MLYNENKNVRVKFMKLKWKNAAVAFLLFVGIGFYFFYKSANNSQGLIINHLLYLNPAQAAVFYLVLGCLCIGILLLCAVAIYLQNKQKSS